MCKVNTASQKLQAIAIMLPARDFHLSGKADKMIASYLDNNTTKVFYAIKVVQDVFPD